ncbi:MAG: NusA-like transcription termination signal-binding factor [Nanoarchaeota archaeon]|nr:NusA-like transcription termination signal-binding factor [Nanoarchaeota archaeon]MCG2717869.1 NusA-like transcription termination signal-binding factor [Nanoarchaeota archaeon]
MKVITTEIIGYINLFERITRARVKNCYQGHDSLIFIVYEGEAGKAIGKKGDNVKRLNHLFKKRVKIVEYNNDPLKFIGNLILPIRAENIRFEDEKTIIIEGKGIKFKQVVLGPERKNLKEIQNIVSNYFDVEIKVK